MGTLGEVAHTQMLHLVARQGIYNFLVVSGMLVLSCLCQSK